MTGLPNNRGMKAVVAILLYMTCVYAYALHMCECLCVRAHVEARG